MNKWISVKGRLTGQGDNGMTMKNAENAIMALLGVLKETEKRLDNYKERFDWAVELKRLDDPIRHEIRFRVEELAPLGREQAELLVFEKIMSAAGVIKETEGKEK